MHRRKATVGLSLLCALVFFAFSASSASAVTGTTAFTCVANVEKVVGFSDEHCTKTEASPAKFKHVAIPENTTTKTHITNERTNATTTEHTVLSLKAEKQPLVGETEITCTKVQGHGDLTNDKNEATKEHTIHGTKTTLLYTECKFVKPSFCKVKGGQILAEGITATSVGVAGEKKLLFKPEVGKTFVTIEAEGFGCPTKLPVEGEAIAKENGATLEFDHTENTKKLKVNEQPAGLGGKVTVRSAETTTKVGDPYEETGTPISATTVET